MIRNFTADADDITTRRGRSLAWRFIDHVQGRIVAFQEETGHMRNLEATFAEDTTYRLHVKTRSASRIFFKPVRQKSPITQIPASFLSTTPTTPSRPRGCRKRRSRTTPAELCFIFTCANESRRPRPVRNFYAERSKTSVCPPSLSPQHPPSAQSTVTVKTAACR